VGRTLLSAAFDFDLDVTVNKKKSFSALRFGESFSKFKVKGGGQECPPHTGLILWHHVRLCSGENS